MTVPWLVPADVIAATAMLCTAECALRLAARRGLDGTHAFGAILAAAAGAAVGGHVLHVAVHGAGGAGDWLRFWGEQSVFGMLIGGGIGAVGWLRSVRAPLLAFADVGARAVALGYAIARVGCFLNGDDFGMVTTAPWGVRYGPGTEAWHAHVASGWIPADAALSLPVLPVQLALAAAGLGIFILLGRVSLRPGGGFALAAIIYGAVRLVVEPLRGDFAPVFAGASLPQLFAMGLVAAGVAVLRSARVAGAPAPLAAAGDARRVGAA